MIQSSAIVNGVRVVSSSISVTWTTSGGSTTQASIALLPQPRIGGGAWVGAFTDGTGGVIQPSAVGATAKTFLVPAGGTQRQVLIDDPLFADNGGGATR